MSLDDRRALLDAPDVGEQLARAGVAWEWLSGWLNGPMDAKAWQAVIPSMGYMALLRNLRNFDDAGVSKQTQEAIAKLIDPAEVTRSPAACRCASFAAAWKNVATLRTGGPALERAPSSCR